MKIPALLFLIIFSVITASSLLAADLSTTSLYLQAIQHERDGDYESAYAAYTKILAKESAPVIYIRLADIDAARGDYEKALGILNRGVRAHPDSAELAFTAGAYYMDLAEAQDNEDKKNQYLAESLAAFKKASDLEPTERHLAALAIVARDTKDYGLVIDTYYRLIRDLGLTDYYYSLGVFKIEIGKKEEGMKDLLSSAQEGNVQAFAQLAEYAIADNDTDTALGYLLKMSELRPDLGLVDIYLGEMYKNRQDYENAIHFYLQAADHMDGPMKIGLMKQAAAIALQEEEYALAFETYTQAIEGGGEDDAQLYYLAGHAATMAGSYEAAQDVYDKGLELFPDYAYLLKRAAANLSYLGRTSEALELIKKVDPVERDLDYYFVISNVYNEAGLSEEAIDALEEGIEEYPVSVELYVSLAFMYDNLDRFEECVSVLKKALEIEPGSATVQNFLGYIYADRNVNLDEAEALIDKALAQEPDNYAYLDSKAWVLYRKGLFRQAHEYMLKAIEIAPGDDEELTKHLDELEKAMGIKR
jgi:tetratricopeptide (TPR) repeat protein